MFLKNFEVGLCLFQSEKKFSSDLFLRYFYLEVILFVIFDKKNFMYLRKWKLVDIYVMFDIVNVKVVLGCFLF